MQVIYLTNWKNSTTPVPYCTKSLLWHQCCWERQPVWVEQMGQVARYYSFEDFLVFYLRGCAMLTSYQTFSHESNVSLFTENTFGSAILHIACEWLTYHRLNHCPTSCPCKHLYLQSDMQYSCLIFDPNFSRKRIPSPSNLMNFSTLLLRSINFPLRSMNSNYCQTLTSMSYFHRTIFLIPAILLSQDSSPVKSLQKQESLRTDFHSLFYDSFNNLNF